MAKFHAKFPDVMQNIWKHMNSAKHRIAIPSKTATVHSRTRNFASYGNVTF